MTSRERTYLDFNATAPLRPAARSAMLAALERVGNPSSVHLEGRAAKALIEKARAQVAQMVNVAPRQVVFTSGATEANAMVLQDPRWCELAVSSVEHASVLEPAGRAAALPTMLRVDGSGRLCVSDLEAWLALAADTTDCKRLLSLQWANSETGVVQDIADVAAMAREAGVAFHVDAVQAAGRLPIDLAAVDVTYTTVSSHKLGGPHGVGALIVREGAVPPAPVFVGGGQEQGQRAGTENIAAIAGFGAAAAEAGQDAAELGWLDALRTGLERRACEIAPSAVVLGSGAPRLANTTALALAGRKAETRVIAFDLAGVAVSAGSACSSGKVGRSHVLEAMGVGEELARSAIRVSLGWASKQADVERFLEVWADLVGSRSTAQVA